MSQHKRSLPGAQENSLPMAPVQPVDRAVQAILDSDQSAAAEQERNPGAWGIRFIWIGLLFFLVWAAFAPLSQGVPVAGFLKVEGNVKTVQHLKGGIVESIAVREGDVVREGQLLVKLDDLQLKAQLGVVEAQLVSALAVSARLEAERSGAQAVQYPEFLRQRDDEAARDAMRLQSQLFTSRRSAIAVEEAGTREAIVGLEKQIVGTTAQEKSKAEQLRIFKEEYENLKPMYEQGFIPRNRMFELERAMAMLSGQRSEDIANIGRAQSQIAEARQRILLTNDNYRKEVETQLTEANKQVDDLTQRRLATLDDLTRCEINSPVAGVVVGLTVHTQGGVIGPGQKIMDVVPSDLPLVVEVMIPTHLIDSVVTGLKADIHFSALDRSTVPVVEGTLLYVSADRVADPNRPDITYFIGRVAADKQEMGKISKHELKAGMPAEVVIKTGERTLLEYLAKPLLTRLPFAFKER